MAPRNVSSSTGLDISVTINVPPLLVLRAFFDASAIEAWWSVVRSVTTPRVLGAYAIEWPVTDFRDELLGRLGGVFRGTVMQYEAGRGFFIADAYWLPPDGDPIGPMALEVTCTPRGSGTEVRITQRGFEESTRWRRYYEVAAVGWERALGAMKMLLEKGGPLAATVDAAS
jgi:uncharacterized protein YndB with AHSA1/START domain